MIAHDVAIIGTLQFADGLRLDGTVKGNVVSQADEQSLLVMSEHALICGNLLVYDAVIAGTINGDVTAKHFVELQATARITGNIYYQQLRMDCGASVAGMLTKHETLSAPSNEPAGNQAETAVAPLSVTPDD